MSYCNPILEKISSQLIAMIKKTWNLSINQEITSLLAAPPRKEMGNISFPCFILAKSLKMAPNLVAAKLADHFEMIDLITSVSAEGPYLNFTLNTSSLGLSLIPSILSGQYFKFPLISNEKIMIEYSQPNTHKDMHVGHMRNLCLGNSLVRMNKYIGNDIISATYPGDSGTHVAKCLWHIKSNNLMNQVPDLNKGAWLGQVYTSSEIQFQKLSDLEKIEIKKEYANILTQIHDQKGYFFDLWQETRLWSIDLMKSSYLWADVEFDHWFFESEEDANSVKYIKDLYSADKLIKNDGAIGMDLSSDKLKFCLLLKTDGTGLYSTKDVMLAKSKFEKYNITKNIYIVDDRQKFHFKQVFKVLEKLGFPHAKDCIHLPYAMVELPDGAMSSRNGNIILLSELILKMEAMIVDNYLSKYIGDWPQQEIKDTSSAIANAAIKYGMLRVDNNRKIVFDMAQWLKLDGETGPYLMYVVARINSINQKLPLDQSFVDYDLLTTPQEKEILLHLIYFNDVVRTGASKLQTIHMCSYLYQLAKLFNSFYAECSILKANTEGLKFSRLALTLAVKNVLTQGLACLGIKTIDRM